MANLLFDGVTANATANTTLSHGRLYVHYTLPSPELYNPDEDTLAAYFPANLTLTATFQSNERGGRGAASIWTNVPLLLLAHLSALYGDTGIQLLLAPQLVGEDPTGAQVVTGLRFSIPVFKTPRSFGSGENITYNVNFPPSDGGTLSLWVIESSAQDATAKPLILRSWSVNAASQQIMPPFKQAYIPRNGFTVRPTSLQVYGGNSADMQDIDFIASKLYTTLGAGIAYEQTAYIGIDSTEYDPKTVLLTSPNNEPTIVYYTPLEC